MVVSNLQNLKICPQNKLVKRHTTIGAVYFLSEYHSYL